MGQVPLLVGFGLAACTSHVPPGQTAGELGNGTFSYVCVDDSDPACVGGAKPDTFPTRVGLGGTFQVAYSPKDGGIDHYDIHSAAPGVLEEAAGSFIAKSAGTVALLVQRTSDGRIFDFVHLSVADLHELRLDANGAAPLLVWHTGALQTLRATAIDVDRVTLAGSREFEWTTSDDSRVRLERQSPTASMALFPRAPGAATITVTSGAATVQLLLTIQGAPVRDEDAGTSVANTPDARAPIDATTVPTPPPATPPVDASVPDGSDR